MRIRTLRAEDRKAVEQVASLLLEGFREHHPTAWPDMESALKEVEESFAQDRLSRIAVDDSGAVLGWIGGGLRHCRRDAGRQRLGKAGHLHGQAREKRSGLSDRQLIWKKKS